MARQELTHHFGSKGRLPCSNCGISPEEYFTHKTPCGGHVVGKGKTKVIESRPSARAREKAEEALKALGKEDLLFPHHGDVHARPEAYERLAEFFEAYADERTFEGG